MIKKLAKKYPGKKAQLEKWWAEAKKEVEGGKKKYNNKWAVIMTVFEKILKSHGLSTAAIEKAVSYYANNPEVTYEDYLCALDDFVVHNILHNQLDFLDDYWAHLLDQTEFEPEEIIDTLKRPEVYRSLNEFQFHPGKSVELLDSLFLGDEPQEDEVVEVSKKYEVAVLKLC